MSVKPSLSGIMSPIIVPVLFFFCAYFLFPDFSYNFFGTSYKHRNINVKAEIEKEEKNTENQGISISDEVTTVNISTPVSQNAEYDYHKDAKKLKDITTTVVNTVGEGVSNGIKTIKNVFEYPDGNGTSKDVLNKYKQPANQETK